MIHAIITFGVFVSYHIVSLHLFILRYPPPNPRALSQATRGATPPPQKKTPPGPPLAAGRRRRRRPRRLSLPPVPFLSHLLPSPLCLNPSLVLSSSPSMLPPPPGPFPAAGGQIRPSGGRICSSHGWICWPRVGPFPSSAAVLLRRWVAAWARRRPRPSLASLPRCSRPGGGGARRRPRRPCLAPLPRRLRPGGGRGRGFGADAPPL